MNQRIRIISAFLLLLFCACHDETRESSPGPIEPSTPAYTSPFREYSGDSIFLYFNQTGLKGYKVLLDSIQPETALLTVPSLINDHEIFTVNINRTNADSVIISGQETKDFWEAEIKGVIKGGVLSLNINYKEIIWGKWNKSAIPLYLEIEGHDAIDSITMPNLLPIGIDILHRPVYVPFKLPIEQKEGKDMDFITYMTTASSKTEILQYITFRADSNFIISYATIDPETHLYIITETPENFIRYKIQGKQILLEVDNEWVKSTFPKGIPLDIQKDSPGHLLITINKENILPCIEKEWTHEIIKYYGKACEQIEGKSTENSLQEFSNELIQLIQTANKFSWGIHFNNKEQ